MKLYELTYAAGMWGDHEAYSELKMAKSTGAAKYGKWLEARDCRDISFIDFCKNVKVRKVSQPEPLPESEPYEHPERIELINKLIQEIGSRGRRFFYSKQYDRYAAFHWANGHLWYTDDYTGEPMLMEAGQEGKTQDQKNSFSHGGTLWGLIQDFRDYIFGDDDSNHNNGYGGLYSPHWAYPEEDMEAIRRFAVDAGYLKTSKKQAV